MGADRFGHFVDYLSSISTPAAPYIPAAWAANLLSIYLLDREIDWLVLGLIVISPVALFFIGEWAMNGWFFNGYSKSQESFGGYRNFNSGTPYRPGARRWIAAKETKTFLRDSAEWSQLFMIAALVVVYLYNFKMLPVDRSIFGEEYITNIISFLNIGLTGFIVASLSARFVYPSIGAEGGAFHIIRSSPVSLGNFMFHKYLYYVVPFTIMTLGMVVTSDHLLNITGPMWWISVGTTLLICWTVVAMAVGFGAIHADFKAESRAAALGGMGAVLFLFTAMAYEIIIICLGFFPAYKVVGKWLRKIPVNAWDLTLLSGWIIFAFISGIFIAVFFFRKGVNSLQSLP